MVYISRELNDLWNDEFFKCIYTNKFVERRDRYLEVNKKWALTLMTKIIVWMDKFYLLK